MLDIIKEFYKYNSNSKAIIYPRSIKYIKSLAYKLDCKSYYYKININNKKTKII